MLSRPVSTLGSLPAAFQNVFLGRVACRRNNCASAYIFQSARVPQRFGGSQMFQMSFDFFLADCLPAMLGIRRMWSTALRFGMSSRGMSSERDPHRDDSTAHPRVLCPERVQSRPPRGRCRPGTAGRRCGPGTRQAARSQACSRIRSIKARICEQAREGSQIAPGGRRGGAKAGEGEPEARTQALKLGAGVTRLTLNPPQVKEEKHQFRRTDASQWWLRPASIR
jgi:hypothetical protein